MKVTEVQRYLENKMKFIKKERSRHIHYTYRTIDNKLPLPTVICLPRSKKELGKNVVGSVSKSIGLKERHFKHSVSCNHSRECDLICLVTRLLTECVENDKTYPPKIIIPILKNILIDIDKDQANKSKSIWNQFEKKSLEICKTKLKNLENGNHNLMASIKFASGIIERYW